MKILSFVLTSSVLYWSTALDLLVILMLINNRYSNKRQAQKIAAGQFIGSNGLIVVSLFLAFVLHFVPQHWILGFLGLIPLGFGLKYLFFGDDDEEKVEATLSTRKDKNLLWTVALIAFASCGADNIGLFTPYFLTLSSAKVIGTLVIFELNIILLIILGKALAQLSFVSEFLERFGRWVMAAVYIGLGIMIIIESGTWAHFFG